MVHIGPFTATTTGLCRSQPVPTSLNFLPCRLSINSITTTTTNTTNKSSNNHQQWGSWRGSFIIGTAIDSGQNYQKSSSNARHDERRTEILKVTPRGYQLVVHLRVKACRHLFDSANIGRTRPQHARDSSASQNWLRRSFCSSINQTSFAELSKYAASGTSS